MSSLHEDPDEIWADDPVISDSEQEGNDPNLEHQEVECTRNNEEHPESAHRPDRPEIQAIRAYRADVEHDHTPDFVSLLSLLALYFTEERFPRDGKSPRILMPGVPLRRMQGDLLGRGRTFTVSRFDYLSPTGVHQYAVKQPRLAERGYKELLRLILSELRVMTLPPLVQHESICRLVGYGWDPPPAGNPFRDSEASPDSAPGPLPYLIVEYCECGTLANFLDRKQRVGLATRTALLRDVARGLLALHREGIVHCDVKAENVLIAKTPDLRPAANGKRRGYHYTAKVTDFGFAITDVYDPRILGQGGFPPLSYPWSAPEAFGYVKLTDFPALDVYSFGLLAVGVLLHIENPFEAVLGRVDKMNLTGRKELWMDKDADMQERVSSLKRLGMTKSALLGLVKYARWLPGEGNGALIAERVINCTLNMEPSRRNLRAAAWALTYLPPRRVKVTVGTRTSLERRRSDIMSELRQRRLGRFVRSKRWATTTEHVPVGALSKKHPWKPFMIPVNHPHKDWSNFPSIATQRVLTDLEARFREVPSKLYLITLVNCYMHGIGSGTRLPQPAGLGKLCLEARALTNERDGGPIFHFVARRYFEALGIPLPELLQNVRVGPEVMLVGAAACGSNVALQVLRAEFPNTYMDLRSSQLFALRGQGMEVFKMASKIYVPMDAMPEAAAGDESSTSTPPTTDVNLHELAAAATDRWESLDPDLFERTGETILHAAAASPHVRLDFVEALLDSEHWRENINALNVANRETPLFQACRGGFMERVRLLVSRGAQVDTTDSHGETCLHWTPSFNEEDMEEFVSLMVSHGADINAVMPRPDSIVSFRSSERSYCQGTPLQRAVSLRSAPAVRVLLQHGADPHLGSPQWDGNSATVALWFGTWAREMITPIQLAAKLAFPEVLDVLLDKTPDAANAFDDDGTSLWCYVDEDPSYGYYLHGAGYSAAVQGTVSVLIARGADVNVAASTKYALSRSSTDDVSYSALHVAVEQNRFDLARAVLPLVPPETINESVRFSAVPKRQYTPLQLAIKWGNVDLVRLLIDHGADCREPELPKSSENASLLRLCVGQPNAAALLELLVEHGAALDLGHELSLNPLFASVLESQFELADLLIASGANVHHRIGGRNLLWYLFSNTDEPTTVQVQYVLDRMGTDWDATFITDTRPGAWTSVFMIFAIRSSMLSMPSNTVRSILRLLLQAFPTKAHQDYHTPSGLNAVDMAIETVNFDVCDILIMAGALVSEMQWGQTLKFAIQKLHAPVPVRIRRAGKTAVSKHMGHRMLIVELLLPEGETMLCQGVNGELILLQGKGRARQDETVEKEKKKVTEEAGTSEEGQGERRGLTMSEILEKGRSGEKSPDGEKREQIIVISPEVSWDVVEGMISDEGTRLAEWPVY